MKNFLIIILLVITVIFSGCTSPKNEAEHIRNDLDESKYIENEEIDDVEIDDIQSVCQEETSTVSIPQLERYEDFGIIEKHGKKITKNISLVYLNSDEADFQQLSATLTEVADRKKQYVYKKIDEFKEDTKKNEGDVNQQENGMISDTGVPYESRYEQVDYVQRIDAHYLSILNISEDYIMQLSNDTMYDAYNYNILNGEKILLSDVIPDSADLKIFLINKLEELKEVYSLDIYSVSDSIDKHINYDYYDSDNQNGFTWYMDECGITVIFRPYEVSRNSCWITIPYSSDLIAKEYYPYRGEEFESEYDPFYQQYCN